MFCARSRPTNEGNREQKSITKKLDEFHNQFVLLAMVQHKTKTQEENLCILLYVKILVLNNSHYIRRGERGLIADQRLVAEPTLHREI